MAGQHREVGCTIQYHSIYIDFDEQAQGFELDVPYNITAYTSAEQQANLLSKLDVPYNITAYTSLSL